MEPESNPGLAVDAGGNPVVDPTKNVERLVAAEGRRQDDLRQAARERSDAESRHVREVVQIHSTYGEKLRVAETGRIDAIRQVDQSSVQRTAEVQATREATLAAQVAESAAAMRVQVEAAAKAAAESLGKALEPIQKDIQDLRRVQYEGVGQKGQVAETRAGGANTALWIGLAVSGALLLLTLIGLIVMVLTTRPA